MYRSEGCSHCHCQVDWNSQKMCIFYCQPLEETISFSSLPTAMSAYFWCQKRSVFKWTAVRLLGWYSGPNLLLKGCLVVTWLLYCCQVHHGWTAADREDICQGPGKLYQCKFFSERPGVADSLQSNWVKIISLWNKSYFRLVTSSLIPWSTCYVKEYLWDTYT